MRTPGSILLILLLSCRAVSADCTALSVGRAFRGRILVQIDDARTMQPSAVCVADPSGIQSISMEGLKGLSDVAWTGTNEILTLRCNQSSREQPVCAVASMKLKGQPVPIFPPQEKPEFQEADGRRTPWQLTKARLAPNGLLAVILQGQALVFAPKTGDLHAAFGNGVRDLAWISSGQAIAFAQPAPNEGGTSAAIQLFVYDLRSRTIRQLTHFPPRKISTWNPLAQPLLTYPTVSGLSWASKQEAIGFMDSHGDGFYLSNESGRLTIYGELGRGCYSHPVVSSDATHVVYANGSTKSSCLIGGADQVRVRDLRDNSDELVLRVVDERLTVRRLDWIE